MEYLSALTEHNKELSQAAASLGRAHEIMAKANLELAQSNKTLAEKVKQDSHERKACTPANPVEGGGGRATKHAATG